MALRHTSINVPLGGGIDSDTEDFLVQPPRVLQAYNVQYTRRGGLKKRTGWDHLGTVTKGDSSWAVVPAHSDGSSVGIFSENQAKRFYAGASRDIQLPPVPHSVTAHPIQGFRGHVLMAQAAHDTVSGLTAVAVSVAEDVTDIANHEGEALDCWVYIVDSDWNVIKGPTNYPDIAILPRIHVMEQAGGAEVFMFLGLQDESGEGGAGGTFFLDADKLSLNAFTYTIATGTFSSVSTLATDVYPFDIAGGQQHVMWDSHCSGEAGELCHVTYYDSSSNLISGRVDTALTYNTRTVANPVTGGSVTTFHDPATDTVLVYTAETSRLYYADDTTGSFSSILHPASPTGDFPILYLTGARGLMLTDRTVTLTGSGPATPSLGGGGSYIPSFGNPVPRSDGSNFFWNPHVAETDFGADQQRYTGGKSLTVFESGPNGVREIALSALAATRWDSYYTGTFFSGGAESLGVFQQLSLTADGNVLVPLFYPNAGYLPPPKNYGVNWTAASSSGVEREFVNSHSAFDGAYQLVLTEISFDDPVHTYVDHYGTAVAAMGQTVAFDGSNAINLSAQEPRGTIGFSSSPSAAYLLNAGRLITDMTLATNESITWRFLLSYVDKNGVRYRFPVYGGDRSDPTAQPYDNTSGSTEYPTFFLLTSMPPGLVAAADLNGLSVEIYATSVYAVGAASPQDENLVGRVPLVWDSANSRWIGDLYDIIENDSGLDNPTPWPFYTEILPTAIPATNVITRAGNYMFLSPSEAPYELWVSKPLGSRLGPEFSPELILDAPHDSGGIVSLAATGDHLFLLCRNGVWELFVGSGGVDADGGGSFPAFRKVSTDGCLTARGTVETPAGIFYMGYSGIQLVGPGGSGTPGDLVTRHIEDTGLSLTDIRSAYYSPEDREVWFYFLDDPSLSEAQQTGYSWVFDLDSQAWTYTQFRAFHAFRYKNQHARYYGTSDLVTQGTGTTDAANYSPTSSYILAQIKTPWLKLDTPVSYKRFRRLTTLWNWYAGYPDADAGRVGSIIIKVAYNYDDTVVDTFTWMESAGFFHVYGLSSLDSIEHLQSRFSRQKVDSVQITIEEGLTAVSQETGGNTLQWVLAALGLEVADKKGDIKLQQEAKK